MEMRTNNEDLSETCVKNNKGKVPLTIQQNKNQIPDEIPREKNNHIDDIKKRRSSLRRSITGFGSTFRAVCAAVDQRLLPLEKKRRITELCLNQTLVEMNLNALEKEQDGVAAFSECLRDKLEYILNKIQSSAGEEAHKQESQTRTATKKMKEERLLWNEEFKKRREAYLDAKSKLKDVLQGNVQIKTGRLKSEDTKFLKSLPDFAAVNKKIHSYQNRHYIGLVCLEKKSQQLHRSLSTVDQQLEEVIRLAILPSFEWPALSL